jgi:hypothetical protein
MIELRAVVGKKLFTCFVELSPWLSKSPMTVVQY